MAPDGIVRLIVMARNRSLGQRGLAGKAYPVVYPVVYLVVYPRAYPVVAKRTRIPFRIGIVTTRGSLYNPRHKDAPPSTRQERTPS